MLVQQSNIYEAKSRLSELVVAASKGAEFILARNGRPMAKLVPLQAGAADATWQGRGFGIDPELGDIPDSFDDPLPEEVAALFERGIEL